MSDKPNIPPAVAEFSALKAQPSGVVPAALGSAFITCESGDAGYRVVIKSETLQEAQQVHNWLARLNSSPVSGGENLIRFDFTNGDGRPDSKMMSHDEMRQRYSDLLISNALALGGGSTASAGGVDERAAFEVWAKSTPQGCQLRYVRDALPKDDPRYGEYVSEALRLSWEGWQARASLSAPSHGEQVREWNLSAYVLPACGKPVLAYYLNSHGKGRRIRAEYVKAWTVQADDLSDPDTECVEYSEQEDAYYIRQGWYELIDNWDEYGRIAVHEGVITHWQELPAAPSAGTHKLYTHPADHIPDSAKMVEPDCGHAACKELGEPHPFCEFAAAQLVADERSDAQGDN